jgi:hypothetical protein
MSAGAPSSVNDTRSVSPAAEVSTAAPQKAFWRDPIFVILLLLAAFISLHITRGEFHFAGDEMRHAMTGAFFRDALVDHPFHAPFRYARQYFAKYPALGTPHWPPLFHLVEGVFFLVFGFSVWASRLCVLCYALMGVYFSYRISERIGPRHLALLSALLFPLTPLVFLYERLTMLEIPALALSLGAIHFWLKYLDRERARDIWLVGAFTAAAFLTSQKALFIAAFLGVHFLILRPWRVLRRPHFWMALVAGATPVVVWYLFSFGTMALSYERVIGPHISRNWSAQFLYYPQKLLVQLPIVWVILGVAGFFWALVRRPRQQWFLLVWVAVCYVCFSVIQEKDVRHTMFWIPALVYLGLLLMEELIPSRRWVWAGFAALATYTLVIALQTDRPRIWGVEEVAKYVSAQPESDIVYYQGPLNGDFIFFVRKYDPEKRRMVAREKQIVATKIMAGYGTREILTTRDQVLRFFESWGIRYAVVENTDRKSVV